MFIFKPSETCYHSTLDLFKIYNLDQEPLGHWDGKTVIEATKTRSKPKPPRGSAKSVFTSTTQPIRDLESQRLKNEIKRMDIEWCANYGELSKSARGRLDRVGGILERAADIHNRMLEVVDRESEREIKLKLELLESLLEGVQEVVAYPANNL